MYIYIYIYYIYIYIYILLIHVTYMYYLGCFHWVAWTFFRFFVKELAYFLDFSGQ